MTFFPRRSFADLEKLGKVLARNLNPDFLHILFYLTSVTQKNVPGAVVYYNCAWYVFLHDRRYKGRLGLKIDDFFSSFICRFRKTQKSFKAKFEPGLSYILFLPTEVS